MPVIRDSGAQGSVAPTENRRPGPQQDRQVQAHRPVVYLIEVELDRLVPGRGTTADLPQAGEAGLHEQPTPDVRRVASTSSGSGGRGPTRDMWPRMTLRGCGSSSSALRRRKEPNRVIRGSSRALTSRPFSLKCARFARAASESRCMVRNLSMVKWSP